MTKSFHSCPRCRENLLGKDLLKEIMDEGSLQLTIQEIKAKIEEFDRIIKALNNESLGIYASEALEAFLNARSRYRAVLEILNNKLQNEEGGVSGKCCSDGKCSDFQI